MDINEQYERIGNDPKRWLERAEGLMWSAELCWDAVQPIFQTKPKPDEPFNFEQLTGYWRSFLLLTAYAFENLYRGILTTRGRSWREALKSRNKSHALSEHLSSVTDLNDEERKLVGRLETYLLWAGRYPVPLSGNIYARDTRESREALFGSDWNTALRLFDKLRSLINR